MADTTTHTIEITDVELDSKTLKQMSIYSDLYDLNKTAKGFVLPEDVHASDLMKLMADFRLKRTMQIVAIYVTYGFTSCPIGNKPDDVLEKLLEDKGFTIYEKRNARTHWKISWDPNHWSRSE
jgi:hypothetical protein